MKSPLARPGCYGCSSDPDGQDHTPPRNGSRQGGDGDAPVSIPVQGAAGNVCAQIASESWEWEQAFRLLAANYRKQGYEPAGAGALRFTPHQALPEAVTFVVKRDGQVLATLSYVPDNALLGLPMESIFGPELDALRRSGRRLGELTGLASASRNPREFLPMFVALVRLSMQHHAAHGGDTAVIAVNPRHRGFYTKLVGFVPLGSFRPYPSVQGALAEAFWLDWELMKANAPIMYHEVFGQPLPARTLAAAPMPWQLVEDFARQSAQTSAQQLQAITEFVEAFGKARRW